MNENAIQEKINYCLNCKIKPCSNKGCPLGNDIPTFIKFAKEGKIEDAYTTISKTSVLPGICGRVCPHKKQCEGSCVRGIRGDSVDIGTIESYIFDKAMEGCNTSQICYYMNEQKVPTPGKYNQMNGLLRQGNYKMPDKEVVWDTGMIRTILGRFEYTGALVMGRRHTVAVGSKVTRKTAERDVVIRKNINPAIITEEEYEVASASIMFMTKPEYRGAKDFLLKGKVRCGNCHRSLAYTDGGIHPKIYCPHKVQAGRYSHCPEDAYPVSVIEGHIWYSLKRILRILDSVQRESEEKYTDNSFTGKKQQRVLESELEKLKNERIHQYEAYAEGVLSREKYITVKKQLTEKIEKIQSEQKALASVIIEEERYRSRIRTAVQQLEVQIERGKLTKEIIDTMIDTVYVYDKKRIEVILRFDDVLQKVISEYTEGAKGA